MTPSTQPETPAKHLDHTACSARVFSTRQFPAKTPDFDRIARAYRWMEYFTFGPSLSRCRFAFFPGLATARKALILGDGDGRFTARLLQANPTVHVHAVDASPAMLRLLRHRAGPLSSRLSTEVADARFWTPPPSAEPFDLVVTHFFLDCLTTPEIHTLAARILPRLAPGARWIVSEFALPSGPIARAFARPLIACLYWAFSLLTGLSIRNLPDHPAALSHSGFTRQSRRKFLRGLLVSEIWYRTPIQPTQT